MSIRALCTKVDMKPQNYYKARQRHQVYEVDESLVVALVQRERRLHPRIGGRKLHIMLRPELRAAGIRLGRDRFFELLKKNGLLVEPLPRAPRTTNSCHCLPVFHNLIRDLEISAPNEVWVSDITYLRTRDGFVYLALIMDLYSRKIVGYHCGDSLESSGCVAALETALADLTDSVSPIHHSDRGCQYCCHQYVSQLQERGMPISMTEENHCYENANAERLNGILKQEYGLRLTFSSPDQARKAVAQAVWLYNTRRPHTNLKYRTPEEAHNQAA